MICAFHRQFLAQRQIHEWNGLSTCWEPLMLQLINLHHHSISTQNRHQERLQEFLYQGYHVQLWDVGRQKDAEKSDVKIYTWVNMKIYNYRPGFWSLKQNLLSKLSLKEFEIIIVSTLQIKTLLEPQIVEFLLISFGETRISNFLDVSLEPWGMGFVPNFKNWACSSAYISMGSMGSTQLVDFQKWGPKPMDFYKICI